MNCERVRECFGDFLDGAVSSEQREELDAHLVDCASCRETLRELEELRNLLGGPFSENDGPVVVETPNPRGLTRLMDAYRLGREEESPSSGWRRGLGAAALVLLGVALGLLGRWEPSSAPGDSYLLLVRGPIEEATQETAHAVREYADWAASLEGEGRLLAAERLDPSVGYRLIGEKPLEERGDIASPKEHHPVQGFFLYRAESAQEALEIANDCPHLIRGGTLDLRRVASTVQ